MLKALQITPLDGADMDSTTAFVSEASPPLPPVASEELPEMEEFKLFRDYLGLFNLVKSFGMKEEPTASDASTEMDCEFRERRDSLGSAGSEFSSSNSAESCDIMDFCYLPYGSEVAYKHGFEFEDSLARSHSPTETRPLPPSVLFDSNLSRKLPTQHQTRKPQVCVFCRNNGESESFYTSHYLKDADGKVTCPVLRAYTCPLCGANGDKAHTIKYCPENAQSVKNGGAVALKKPSVMLTRKK